MNTRRCWRWLQTLAVAVSMGGGAAQEPFVWPDAWSADAAEARHGGTIRLFAEGEPRSFNPFSASGEDALFRVTGRGAALLIQEPLAGEWLPYGAASYTISPDGLVVDMKLREGLRWSDGTPVTVDDYLFAYRAHSDPQVQSTGYGAFIIDGDPIRLEATGPDTLRWTLPKSDRTALATIALQPAPDHVLGAIYRTGGAAALRAAWGADTDLDETVWTSAFIPVEHVAGERLVLERNPHFGEWNVDERGRALPYLDRLHYTVTPSASPDTGVNLFLAGELDLFEPATVDALAAVHHAIERRGLDAEALASVGPAGSSHFLTFNWNLASRPFLQSLFRSRDFRRAMSHLVDRRAIAELVYGGGARPQWSSVYLAYPEWVSHDVPRYPYDPDRAVQLLEGLGLERRSGDAILSDGAGHRVSFSLAFSAGSAEASQTVQIVADAARAVGVDIRPRPMEFGLLVDQILSTGDDRPFEAVMIGLAGGSRDWPFGANVVPCEGRLHLYNRSGACLRPQETLAARLYHQGRRTMDEHRARSVANELQRVQADMQARIHLVSPDLHLAWRRHVGGLHPKEMMNDAVGTHQLELLFVRPR